MDRRAAPLSLHDNLAFGQRVKDLATFQPHPPNPTRLNLIGVINPQLPVFSFKAIPRPRLWFLLQQRLSNPFTNAPFRASRRVSAD